MKTRPRISAALSLVGAAIAIAAAVSSCPPNETHQLPRSQKLMATSPLPNGSKQNLQATSGLTCATQSVGDCPLVN